MILFMQRLPDYKIKKYILELKLHMTKITKKRFELIIYLDLYLWLLVKLDGRQESHRIQKSIVLFKRMYACIHDHIINILVYVYFLL